MVATEIGKGNWAQGVNGRGEEQPGGVAAKREPIRSSSSVGFCKICGAWRGCHGLEPTPELFVAHEVLIFREVRRVLRRDGTCWVNLGDSYATNGSSGGQSNSRASDGEAVPSFRDSKYLNQHQPRTAVGGLKVKDLCGIPWRVAFALQADGWYLRSDIIWAKPNPMPESVTDRPTKAHEYIFLLTKSPRYFYDAEAVREITGHEADPAEYAKADGRRHFHEHDLSQGMQQYNPAFKSMTNPNGRNRRTVWTIATEPFPGAHFATFPQKLVEPCILAGCPEKCCPKCGAPWVRETKREAPPEDRFTSTNIDTGDVMVNRGFRKEGKKRGSGQKYQNWLNEHPPITLGFHPSCTCGRDPVPGIVLDPFFGSGTVGVVALKLRRSYIGIELNPEYAELARNRIEHGTVDADEIKDARTQATLFDISNSEVLL